MGKSYREKRKRKLRKKIENTELHELNKISNLEFDLADCGISKSGFSTFKKIKRKRRKAKTKQALKDGRYDEVPRFKNSDEWEFF